MRRNTRLDVSRETFQRLETYAELLRKWTPRINLVGKSTVDEIWDRHIEDSAQLYRHAPHRVDHWADLGSGGGFPGLVIAIMGAERISPGKVTLVESDVRKAAFLRTVIREPGITATVVNARIESVAPLQADVVSARALASLTTLLGLAERHLLPGGTALFPKGASWKNELSEAQEAWNFRARVATSETEPKAAILTVSGVARV